MEIFKLFGSVMIDTAKAEESLHKVESKFTTIGQKMQDFGGKMKDVGGKLTKLVTVPLVAAGVASFKFAADLEDAMGASDQIFKTASGNIKRWAAELQTYYGISESEALTYANTMGAMLQNIGGLSEQEASKMSQTLVELAGDLTAMFGGTTESAIQALTGALKGNNSMLDNYGMGVNDATIKTKALEMGLYDGTGQMDLATKQAATLALIMEQTADAQGQAAREAEGASGSWRALQTELKNISTEIGTVLLPIITPLLQKLKDMVALFGTLSPETQKMVIAIVGVAAAIGPLLIAFGNVITAAGAIAGALPAIGGAFAALISPIGLVVAAIAAAIAIGISLYQNWDTIKQKAGELGAKIGEVWDGLKESIGNAWESLKTAFNDLWEGISTWFINLIKSAYEWGGNLVTGIKNGIGNIWDKISGAWNAFWSALAGWFSGKYEAMKTFATNIITKFKDGFNAIWSKISGAWNAFWSALTGWFSGKYETAKSWGTNIINKVKEGIGNIWSKIVSNFNNFSTSVSGFFTGLVETAKNWGIDIIEGIKKGIGEKIDSLVTKAQGIVQAVKDGIAGFLFGSPSKLMAQYGQWVAEGMAGGIEEKTPAVKTAAEKMKDAVTGALDKIKTDLTAAVDLAKAKFDYLNEVMGENASEAEKLKVKQDMLTDSYMAQKQVVAVTEKAYQDMVKATGASSEASIKLETQLYREKTALAQVGQELAQVNSELTKMKTNSDSAISALFAAETQMDRTLAKSLRTAAALEKVWNENKNITSSDIDSALGSNFESRHGMTREEYAAKKDLEERRNAIDWAEGVVRRKGSNVSDSTWNAIQGINMGNLSDSDIAKLVDLRKIEIDAGRNWKGTDFWRGGLTWVGEKGPELMDLPRGTKIYPHEESKKIAGGSGVTQHITINSPKPLSPYEVARQVKNASRKLAMEW